MMSFRLLWVKTLVLHILYVSMVWYLQFTNLNNNSQHQEDIFIQKALNFCVIAAQQQTDKGSD